MSKKFYLISLLFYFCALFMSAQNSLRLSPIFASGMVLQQNADVIFWGWGEPNKKVNIFFGWDNKMLESKVNEKGRWEVKVKTPSAGYTPYTVSICSAQDSILLSDILIGDVWFVGGQSNMQMNFHGNPDQPVQDAQKILLRCKHKGIRLFRVNNGYAISASDTLTIDGKWTSASPDNVKEFSVVGYIFGEKLHELTDIPIGLVQSAHGGSSAEAWLDYETLERFGGFDLNLERKKIDPIWYAFEPTVLYNKMLAPMLPLTVKGVIWYQGESNRDNPSSYNLLMEKMIASWRKGFGKNFPFYMVQIAPYNYHSTNNGPALIREAQEQVAHRVDNVGLITTTDIGDPDNIHPAQKAEAGFRLANLVLGRTYKALKKGYETPFFTQMTIEKGKAILSFSHTEKKLVCPDKKIRGVTIAGNDGNFVPANARIKENRLIVSSPKIKQPIAVRYCFDDATVGNLFNAEGLPVAPFRTDR